MKCGAGSVPRVTPALSLQWLIGDRDSHCGVVCTRTQVKPVCGSDGRSYESTCELQRARCRDKSLTLAPRSRCRGLDRRPKTQQEVQTTPHHVSFHLSGRNWAKIDQLPAAPAPTSASEVRDLEVKGKTSSPTGTNGGGGQTAPPGLGGLTSAGSDRFAGQLGSSHPSR